MKLSKDKTSLIYNQFLTLSGIPKETYNYRLGNRSALEWVIDQYQVSTDKHSGIANDPNRADDPQYILRLIGQVITVSLETVTIVRRSRLWVYPRNNFVTKHRNLPSTCPKNFRPPEGGPSWLKLRANGQKLTAN